jgi:hypothetical protein
MVPGKIFNASRAIITATLTEDEHDSSGRLALATVVRCNCMTGKGRHDRTKLCYDRSDMFSHLYVAVAVRKRYPRYLLIHDDTCWAFLA